MIRENIYSSVFAFFSNLTVGGSPAFKTATRKLTDWENVEAENQPALLMLQKSEFVSKPRGLPAKWTFTIDLYVYVHTGAINDETVIPTIMINPLIDAIEASIKIDDINNSACTLGGLVSHCYIDGSVEMFEGGLGDQAVVIIPITIVVPT